MATTEGERVPPAGPAPRGQLTRGFVLHRRDYSNTSLLLEVFSAEHGRLPLIAKGAKAARRDRAGLAALLQPFQPLWLAWSGRGEVRTLTRAEAGGAALALAGDALYCGFYVNELLMRLLARNDPHEGLFVHYQRVLAGLAAAAELGTVLRHFELGLLAELGYRLEVSREDSGAPIEPGCRYLFRPERGLERAPSDRVADGATPAGVSGAMLLRLAAGEPLGGTDAREARALLRAALAPHLGGRPLTSRTLFRRAGPARPPPSEESTHE